MKKSWKIFQLVQLLVFAGMTIFLFISWVWPNGLDLRPETFPRDNFFTGLVADLYQRDTSTNVFPSIHVYNSIGVHLAVSHSERLRRRPAIRLGSGILMVLICLSTVFLKQHSVIDLIGAVILAYIMCGIIYGYSWSAQDKKITQKALG